MVQVPFHDDVIEAVQTEDGKIMVNLKSVCRSLGIDDSPQHRKLRTCGWATTTIMESVAQDGKQRMVTMIDHESLPMWLTSINPGKVRPEIREKLLRYQREAKAVLSAWFLGESSDAPGLAAEFAAMKKRMAALERDMTLACDWRDIWHAKAAQMEDTTQTLARIVRPIDGDHGEYMTAREFIDRYRVWNDMGRIINGIEIRAIGRTIAEISRALRVPIGSTAGRLGMVNTYRIDILHAWRSLHELRTRLSTDRFFAITKRPL
jgi:hypothetical protein